MTFDNSLEQKLVERTQKAYKTRQEQGKAEGITLFGQNLRLLPTMQADFLDDLGALQSGDLSKASTIDMVVSCFEEDEHAKIRALIKDRNVDVTFVNDFFEFVLEYYSAGPTVEPSGSSSSGEVTVHESQPATTPVVLADSKPVTPLT